MSQLNQSDIAIVGMGCLFPDAGSLDEFWRNLRDGHDAIRDVPLTHWRPDDYFDADPTRPDHTYARRGGFLKPFPFDPLAYGITPSAIEATDTSQLLGMVAAHAALEDAGYGLSRSFDRDRVSVVMGVTGALELVIPLGARLGHPRWKAALREAGVDDETAREVMERMADSYVGWQTASFPGLLGNVVAGRIASRFDFGGMNCVVDAACASSLAAINLGVQELRSGRSDMVVTGGADTFNDIFMYMCFSKTPALSPSGDARPFSQDADGTILGEGVGAVILKRQSDARRDGDRVYAVIKAMGASSDGRGQAIYAPSATGQAKALKRAYEEAGWSPRSVGLVEAHGTGTKVGDAVEIEALTTVYREADESGQAWCSIGSVKSQIGHAKAAAGVAGLIKVAMALYHKVKPPTIKVGAAARALARSPFGLSERARPWLAKDGARRAALSAFGFGGSNYHCLLEEADHPTPSHQLGNVAQIISYSASSRDAIERLINEDRARPLEEWNEVRALAAKRRDEFRETALVRLLLVVSRGEDVSARLAAASRGEGCYLGEGAQSGTIGFLYPGQGSQYAGMFAGLASASGVFRDVIGSAISDSSADCDHSLADALFPHSAFSDEERDRQADALKRTAIAQPALAVVELAASNLLSDFGIRPAASTGHSFGELVALYQAGVIDHHACIKLAVARGAAMEHAASREEASGMLALGTGLSRAQSLIEEAGADAIVANDNSTTQVVVAGSVAALQKILECANAHGIFAKMLPVAAAFHSRFVSGATRDFGAAVEDSSWGEPSAVVFANSTASPYPRDESGARALLKGQLAAPVRFRECVEAMYAHGVRDYVEVGPKSVLTRLAREILREKDGVSTISIDQSAGALSSELDLAQVLAQLAARGHPVKLGMWDPYRERNGDHAAHVVMITGANHREAQSKQRTSERKSEDVSMRAKDQRDLIVVQSIEAIRCMQEKSAELHAKFLEAQLEAQRLVANIVTGGGSSPFRELPSNPQSPVAPAVQVQTQPSPPAIDERIATRSAASFSPKSSTPPPEPRGQAVRIADTVIAVVAEKTGYPASMLTPGMSLEADLGIDSIKRVEIMAALSTLVPGASSLRAEEFGSGTTLQEIFDKLGDQRTQTTALTEKAEATPAPARDESALLIEIVSEKTGYPAGMLNLSMQLEADLGIDSIKRVEIVAAYQSRSEAARSIPQDALLSIKTLQDVVDAIESSTSTPKAPPTPTPTPTPKQVLEPEVDLDVYDVELATRGLRDAGFDFHDQRIQILATERPDSTPAWLAETTALLENAGAAVVASCSSGHAATVEALGDAPSGVIIVVPESPVDAEEALIKVFEQARGAASAKWVTIITQSGGRLGFGGARDLRSASMLGAVGLAKSLAHEWADVSVRAIDIDPRADAKCMARRIAVELCEVGSSQDVEIGLTENERCVPRLSRARSSSSNASPFLKSDDLVVVTGGARGVTAAACLALAKAERPAILILGRTSLIEEKAALRALTDHGQIKAALAQDIGSGATPKSVQESFDRIIRSRDVRATLDELRALGVFAVYRDVDIRDAGGVKAAIDDAVAQYGPVRGVVHGAGVLADRWLADLSLAEITNVIATKVGGLRNVMAAVEPELLKFMALFSSSTARFGRKGQTAYAAANEALNKIAQTYRRQHPAARIVSFNWGPWDGGMVDQGLKRQFESEGVSVIPLSKGAEMFAAELRAGVKSELVVLGGGTCLAAEPETTEAKQVASLLVSPMKDPVLRDHAFGGRSVLPAALSLELMTAAALHAEPGSTCVSVSNFRVLKGVTLAAAEQANLAFERRAVQRSRNDCVHEMSMLRGTVPLATATITSSFSRSKEALNAISVDEIPSPCRSAGQLYGGTLFHGPMLRCIDLVSDANEIGIAARVRLESRSPSAWLSDSWRDLWVTEPLLLDALFQLMIVWTTERRGTPCLPSGLGRLELGRGVASSQVIVKLRIRECATHQLVADALAENERGDVVLVATQLSATMSPNLAAAFRQGVEAQAGVAAP